MADKKSVSEKREIKDRLYIEERNLAKVVRITSYEEIKETILKLYN